MAWLEAPHALPPRLPAVFNLVERIDVKEMESRVEEYRRVNADSIVRNEALRAEELRRRVAAAEEGAGQAGVSGTAAAFQEGADAEPHQGMEYTATLPEAAAAAVLGTCVCEDGAGRQWLGCLVSGSTHQGHQGIGMVWLGASGPCPLHRASRSCRHLRR